MRCPHPRRAGGKHSMRRPRCNGCRCFTSF
jgi:hypothetical protein